MKITRRQLRQIIKEEITRVNEAAFAEEGEHEGYNWSLMRLYGRLTITTPEGDAYTSNDSRWRQLNDKLESSVIDPIEIHIDTGKFPDEFKKSKN
jgi:hypothetical protein